MAHARSSDHRGAFGLRHILGSAIIGVGLMFLLDPQRGRTRRAKLRDKGRHFCFALPKCKVARQAKRLASFVPDRGRGMLAHLKAKMGEEPVSDDVLIKRVRSRLGHVSPHLGRIQVTAREGEVTLTGSLAELERRPLVEAALHVPGVKHVTDHLDR